MEGRAHVLRFAGTVAGFEAAANALRGLLDEWSLDGLARHHVELAFEEIATNIVRHGGPVTDVEVTIRLDDDLLMVFEDDGVPFDPRDREDPELPLSLEDAKVGGLGIMLVKKFARHIAYDRTPAGRNRLTLSMPAR